MGFQGCFQIICGFGQIHFAIWTNTCFQTKQIQFLFVQIHLGAKSQFRIRDELPKLFAKSSSCQAMVPWYFITIDGTMVLYFSLLPSGTICWPALQSICWSSKLEHKVRDGVLKHLAWFHVMLTKVKTIGQILVHVNKSWSIWSNFDSCEQKLKHLVKLFSLSFRLEQFVA